LYEALSKKGFQVKYITDQIVHANYATIDPTQLSIALSCWQQDTSLSDYFKSSKASVLCIHSYTSALDLKAILETCDQTTMLFFVKLSKTFTSYYLLSWISRIFLRPPQDSMQRLKTRWSIHPLKFKTLQQEKKILNELKKSGVNFEEI
jgi:hypothetical protein